MESKIGSDDLKVISKLGHSLWMDKSYCVRRTSETLAATALMDLSPARTLEKTTFALLERARTAGAASNTQMNRNFLTQKFFKLTPEERFLLIVLHSHPGRWSYARMSRILNQSEEEIQELLWSARLQMEASPIYPAGPATPGPSCLPYDPKKPWTQKFMDDEIGSGRVRFFLQNHLASCPSCAEALARCREVYFKVDKEIAKLSQDWDFSEDLEDVLNEIPYHSYPTEKPWLDALRAFIKRPDVVFAAVSLVGMVLYKIWKA